MPPSPRFVRWVSETLSLQEKAALRSGLFCVRILSLGHPEFLQLGGDNGLAVGIAILVIAVIVLMVVLGRIEGGQRFDLGHDRIGIEG